MTFPTRPGLNVPATNSGEVGLGANVTLSSGTYENGLIPGRFAKIDAGSIDNLDNSTDPVIAGVVTRRANNLIGTDGTYSTDLPHYASESVIDYVRLGRVTVELLEGAAAPAMFAPVYTINSNDDATKGTVTPTAGDTDAEAVEAEFHELVEGTTNIYWILLK